MIFTCKILLKTNPRLSVLFYSINGVVCNIGMIDKTVGFDGAIEMIK